MIVPMPHVGENFSDYEKRRDAKTRTLHVPLRKDFAVTFVASTLLSE